MLRGSAAQRLGVQQAAAGCPWAPGAGGGGGAGLVCWPFRGEPSWDPPAAGSRARGQAFPVAHRVVACGTGQPWPRMDAGSVRWPAAWASGRGRRCLQHVFGAAGFPPTHPHPPDLPPSPASCLPAVPPPYLPTFLPSCRPAVLPSRRPVLLPPHLPTPCPCTFPLAHLPTFPSSYLPTFLPSCRPASLLFSGLPAVRVKFHTGCKPFTLDPQPSTLNPEP